MLRVGWRTGILTQQRPQGVLRSAPKLLTHPLSAGLVHTLNAGNFGDRPAIVDGSRTLYTFRGDVPSPLARKKRGFSGLTPNHRASRRCTERRQFAVSRNSVPTGHLNGYCTLTYAELDGNLNRFVHGLRELGLGPGDRIGLMAPNGWEYLLGFFGALRGGYAAVHVSYRATSDELRYYLDHAEPQALLFSPACWDTVRAVRDRHPTRELHWLCTEALPDAPAVRSLPRLLQGQPDGFPRGQGNLLARAGLRRLARMPSLVYTSGTTGKPKGAVRDFARMGPVEMTRILDRLPLKAGERHLVVCPLYHSGAQAFAAFHSAGGSTLFTLPHFEAEQTLRLLSEQRMDSVFLVPTMIQRILELPAALRRRYRPRLRCLVSGAAPFPQPLRERAIDYFGPVVHDFYGTTEVGWVTLASSEEMLARPHTVGRAIAGSRILILDEAGDPQPTGEVGEIWVASEQTIEGYYRNRRATEQSRRGDAQASGDLGWLDDDGYLYLAGRSSDLIITGGVNVYPAEIEQVLQRHPDVREAAVLGLPDEQWGERVAAFLEGPSPERERALREWARERLTGAKVPKTWVFRDELPRNPTGKVLKRQLREEHLGEEKDVESAPGDEPQRRSP